MAAEHGALDTAQHPVRIKATGIVPAPNELTAQVRQVEGGLAIACAIAGADGGEEGCIAGATDAGTIRLEPTGRRCGAGKGCDLAWHAAEFVEIAGMYQFMGDCPH
ncbi:hypothetical protein D3C84_921610 [compost metagenome]